MKAWIPAAALALALLPLAFLHPVQVVGRSMEPALEPGSLHWALRAWCAGAPRRGQVWLFDGPGGPAVKRVVGLPGERLEQRDGELYLEGARMQEPYLSQFDRGDAGPWQTGAGYLMVGDNRPASQDGRAWGPTPRAALRGRLLGF